MKKIAFPVRYFMSAFTPTAMFKGRHALRWWQQIIVFVFLSALMILPIPIFYAQQTTFNFHAFLPDANALLARQELKDASQQLTFKDDRLQTSENKVIYQTKKALIGTNLTKKQLKQVDNAVDLAEDHFTLQERGYLFQATYQQKNNVSPQKNITKFLQNSWYRSNHGSIMMLMLVSVGLIVVGSNLLLILGAAFFLSLMKRNRQASIKSFGEAHNLVLNASLYGTLAAMVTGLVRFDFSLMFMVFSVVLALMILAIYWRTRFNDEFTNNREVQNDKTII
ncbi:DUF1189 family protein [Lapidilactobacillus luobeiensis]|uniref:DUF1189 family protein n=1 Tax=Lapidilactobacillus luobeiensis TaxID=2950371 RepID=UPI0021C3786A|nr:DUF1189 family protein [Lapidilactobacillus luobeiensis]